MTEAAAPYTTTDDSPISAKLRRFVALDREKRDLKAKLSTVETELKDLESQLLEGFEKSGLSKATIDKMTVYVHRQIWCSPKDGDYERASDALITVGLADFVQRRFNSNTVSAYVRELDARDEALDPQLAEALSVSEVFSLRCRMG